MTPTIERSRVSDADRDGLFRGEVHVWLAWPDRVRDEPLLDRCRALLTEQEEARRQRFVFEKDRHQDLVTRALVRTVLSGYADVDPTAWRFVENRWGRPEISEPSGVGPLHFNLSHTRGLIACAVAMKREIGVDVEDVTRRTPIQDLAPTVFAPAELHALWALPSTDWRERFFVLWTLKEAYIKARGMGLAIPLEQFAFQLEDAARIGVAFDPRLDDDPAKWQFRSVRPSDSHRLALAVGRADAADLRVRYLETICDPEGWQPR